TIDHRLHRGDILAHLKGVKTVGASLGTKVSASAPISTRATCFDVDDPAGWQRLLDAAHLLDYAGFKSILALSPTEGKHAGGGVLWIVFDRIVDAYNARQTLIDAAPALEEIKEY